jgi:hypothetical protein
VIGLKRKHFVTHWFRCLAEYGQFLAGESVAFEARICTAEALGISSQRVQQLLVQGLNRLKEPARSCRLEPYR